MDELHGEITGVVEGLRAENRRLRALVGTAFCAKVLDKPALLDAEWEAKAQALGCGWVTAHAPPEVLEAARRWADAWGTEVPTVTSTDVSAALAMSLQLDGYRDTKPANGGNAACTVTYQRRGQQFDPTEATPTAFDARARARQVLLEIAEGKRAAATNVIEACRLLLERS